MSTQKKTPSILSTVDSRLFFTVSIMALAFTLLLVFQWDRWPRTDEIFFHRAGWKWFTDGPQTDGLWHTPFYLEALRLWQNLFGGADPSQPGSVVHIRSFGLFTGLMSGFILLWAALKARKQKILNVAPFTLADSPLFLLGLLWLHPYFIQSVLLLDIDNTLLSPSILLWVVLATFWDEKKNPSWKDTLLLAAVFSIAMMVKELTPLALPPIWIGWSFLRKWRKPSESNRKHLTHALVGSIIGFIFFLVILVAWTSWNHMNWDAPLALTFEKSSARTGSAPWKTYGWLKWGFLSYLPLLWLMLPVLGPLLAFSRFPRSKKRKSSHSLFTQILEMKARVPLAIWVSVVILICYTWITQASFYFPKYSTPVLPLLIFAIAHHFSMEDPKLTIKKLLVQKNLPLLGLCIGTGLLLFGVTFIPTLDPLRITEFRRDLSFPLGIKHLFSLGIPIFALLGFSVGFGKKSSNLTIESRKTLLAFGALVYLAGLSVNQAIVLESPGYLYGEKGFDLTLRRAKQLKRSASGGQPILTTAIDLDWALQEDADWVVFSELKSPRILDRYTVVVSRTYNNYSVRFRPEWLRWVQERFPCHERIETLHSRFEWWWKADRCPRK